MTGTDHYSYLVSQLTLLQCIRCPTIVANARGIITCSSVVRTALGQYLNGPVVQSFPGSCPERLVDVFSRGIYCFTGPSGNDDTSQQLILIDSAGEEGQHTTSHWGFQEEEGGDVPFITCGHTRDGSEFESSIGEGYLSRIGSEHSGQLTIKVKDQEDKRGDGLADEWPHTFNPSDVSVN